MPTGLRIPVGVDKRGRANVETDQSKNTLKILTLAFSEADDDNAFQDLGLKVALIFSKKDASFRGKALRAIQLILNKFPELVKLDESEPIQFKEDIEGEVEMSLVYIDLLTGRKVDFVKRLIRNVQG